MSIRICSAKARTSERASTTWMRSRPPSRAGRPRTRSSAMISSRDSLPGPRSSRTSSSSRSSLRPTRSPPLASTVGRGGTGNCCRGYSGGARRATSRPGFLRSPAGRCSTTCGARCPRPPPCSRWSPAGPSRAARPPCGPVSFWSRWPCRPSCPRSPSWFCRARASPRGFMSVPSRAAWRSADHSSPVISRSSRTRRG